MEAYRQLDGPATYEPVAETAKMQTTNHEIESQINQEEAAQKQLSTCAKVCKVLCNPKGKKQNKLCCKLYGVHAGFVFAYAAIAATDFAVYRIIWHEGEVKLPLSVQDGGLLFVATVVTVSMSVFFVFGQILMSKEFIRRIKSLEIE